jgi:hypothetical protein
MVVPLLPPAAYSRTYGVLSLLPPSPTARGEMGWLGVDLAAGARASPPRKLRGVARASPCSGNRQCNIHGHCYCSGDRHLRHTWSLFGANLVRPGGRAGSFLVKGSYTLQSTHLRGVLAGTSLEVGAILDELGGLAQAKLVLVVTGVGCGQMKGGHMVVEGSVERVGAATASGHDCG